MSLVSLEPYLSFLLKSLPPRSTERDKLNELVKDTLQQSKATTERTSNAVRTVPEYSKSQWEYLLKNEVFRLAATEGEALKDGETTYYDEIRDRLDLVLSFTENDACEQIFPFIVLQDLLETQTILSCSHIFSWIEECADRLTEGLVPQKGKALILLRTLNDLLRRLSKMGSTTIFCGRILTFLSGVFPLGERSGVNLRGEYGPTWEGVNVGKKKVEDTDNEEMKVEPTESEESKGTEEQGDQMQVDAKEEKKPVPKLPEKKEDFYNTFWSLQLPFSKPLVFVAPEMFAEFRDAVDKVLPVIKEATAKERAMMGSRAGAGAGSLKRKRDIDVEETNINEYFFAKFLTSPDLTDLEIADTHFRRQFLFQLLILLNHLLAFTKAAKATWSSSRNRSLQMDFTLETAEAQWVQDTINKAMEELRQTAPNGRAFAETVSTILDKEKNWVKWKNELCAPFDKESWSVEIDGKRIGLLESTRDARAKMREPPKEWEHKLGSAPLTDIWEMGCRGLEDLRNPFQPGEVKNFVKRIKQEDQKIEMRGKLLAKRAATQKEAVNSLAPEREANIFAKLPELSVPTDAPLSVLPVPRPTTANGSSPIHPSLPPRPGSSMLKLPSSSSQPTPAPAPTAATPAVVVPVPVFRPASQPTTTTITDKEILKFEENKHRWAWLALRVARDQHLQHFGKIGTGDIVELANEIEKEREKIQKGEENPGLGILTSPSDEQGIGSPMISTVVNGAEEIQPIETTKKPDGEGDVRMEDN